MLETLLAITLGAMVLCAILLGVLIVGQRTLFQQSLEKAGGQVEFLGKKIAEAGEYFAPVRHIPCKTCAGTGEVEKENPLLAAIAKAISQPKRKSR